LRNVSNNCKKTKIVGVKPTIFYFSTSMNYKMLIRKQNVRQITLFDEPHEIELRTKALLVHKRLCAEYHCPIAFFNDLDPLSQLIAALLSHRTKNKDTGRAFRQLRAEFPTWEQVRDAPVEQIANAIAASTYPELKAPRIQNVLRLITERAGTLSLDFLADMSDAEARKWLEDMPGVGPKTSASVLLFSNARRRALPVDTHHYRVAMRLGLISEKTSLEKAHILLEAQLPAEWNAQQVYDNHEVLMLHGQQVCFFREPDCHRCVVLDLCPYGQTRMKPRIYANLR
jgi:endonuclease III